MSGIIRQGDVLVVPCDTMPEGGAEKVKREQGRLVLAHGEATGHAHAIADAGAEMLVTKDEAAELYLLVHGTDPVSLVHDEHDTLTIAPGTYRVIRQREYSPEGLRNVMD